MFIDKSVEKTKCRKTPNLKDIKYKIKIGMTVTLKIQMKNVGLFPVQIRNF